MQDGDLYETLMEYLYILEKPDFDLIWGVIGPSGSLGAAADVLPFTANSGVIAVRSMA